MDAITAERPQPTPARPLPNNNSRSPAPLVYPLPIHADKLVRARQLYSQYLQANEIQKHLPETQKENSSGSALAGTTGDSAGGSSVVSTGNELESLPADGEPQIVRARKRANLSPEVKARAALIRHLGSCPVCRARRVLVSLEPHPIYPE